jgi:hypothetical protein
MKLSRENAIAAVFALGMTLLGALDHSYLNDTFLKGVWFIAGVLLLVILVAIMLVAGFSVFRSVVKASVGFTILIFLAQTYCGLPTTTTSGMQSLAFLWSTGMLYIFYQFAKEFQVVCSEHLLRLGEDKRKWEGIFTIVVFILFVALYVAALYQVLNPIINNLCIS